MICGVRLAGAPEPVLHELRFVTVVFCDVVGSTELSSRLSPDAWGAILGRYFAAATDALSRAHGRIEKFIGDAVVAVFGAESAREDDAARAIRAACAIRDHASVEGDRLRESRRLDFAVRLGVASGRVAVAPHRDSSFAIGDVLNRAARLQGAAAPGEVVLDARTWLLTRSAVTTTPLGSVVAKGFPGGVRAWRVNSGDAPASPDPDPAFVGREDLILQLAAYLRGGLDGRHEAIALVEGEAGIGKSRLVDRCWPDLAGDAERIVLRCTADGSHVGLRSLLGLDEALARIDGSTGAPQLENSGVPARTLGDIRWTTRGRLAALVSRRPVLVQVENVQWAAPALVELLELLALSPVRCLAMVLIGRDMPVWADPAISGRRFPVPPLEPDESRRLAIAACGDIELHGDEVLDHMVERSGGNPLYLNQLATLVDESDGRPDLFPPSAEAAVGARLDLLSQPARRLLAIAGAFGTKAPLADLTEAASALGVSISGPLAQLTEQHFVASSAGMMECTVPMAAEVAYRRLTLADRARVHGHIAESFRRRVPQSPAEIELVAHHAVTAHAAWREFDPGSNLERRAARHAAQALCAAARFAIQHSALAVALGYVATARDLDTDDQITRLELAATEAYALLASGESHRALSLAEAALEGADLESHQAAAADLLLTAAATAELVRGQRDGTRIAHAQTLARRSGDPTAISRALLFRAHATTEAGDFPTAQAFLEEAATLVLQASGSLSGAEIYGNLALCLAHGDQPAADALKICERLHREAGGADLLRAAIGCPMAYLQHMAGRPDSATRTLAAAGTVCEEIGHRHGLAAVHSFRAALAERDGDLSRAAQHLGRAAAIYRQAGINDLAGSAAMRQSILEVLTGQKPRSGLPAPRPPRRGWAEEILSLLMTALRSDDAFALVAVLRVLDRVRGAGAQARTLLTCLGVAQHLGDGSSAAEFRARLGAAARQKGDVPLLALIDVSLGPR